MFSADQHSKNSSLRENIIEHQFIAAILKRLWRAGIVDVEILRSEFDSYGYDLVLGKGSLIRHIQLKSGLSLKTVGISTSLEQKQSGCVVFIQVNDSLEMGPYFWFGSSAGQPLPRLNELKKSKHTKANSDGIKSARVNHWNVPKSKFTKLDTMDALLEFLIGQKLDA
jgi:hypothetical protein